VGLFPAWALADPEGTIDGNKPAALPGLISVLPLTVLNEGSGPGSIGARVDVGEPSGVAVGVGADAGVVS
jgi:hypothetical protein